VAQWSSHFTLSPRVAGSNPAESYTLMVQAYVGKILNAIIGPKKTVIAGQLIEVKFTSFSVGEEGEVCTGNYLEIRDGEFNPRLRRIVPRYL